MKKSELLFEVALKRYFSYILNNSQFEILFLISSPYEVFLG